MLTAEKARELANDFKRREQAKYYEYLLDLDGYSKEVRKQIIQILESLGYKVKKKQGLLNFIYYSTNTYVISW